MKQINRSEFIGIASGNIPEENMDETNQPVNKFANKSTPHFSEKSLTGLNEYTAPFGREQLVHLLRRTLFGATQADLDHFDGMTLDEVVTELLIPSATPPEPINAYNNVNFTDPDVPSGQVWVHASYGSGLVDSLRRINVKEWWVGLMINQDRSLTEKMTLFWSDHFATQMMSISDGRYSYKQIATLRANALGNFKSLARLITTDPGMLVYLNGNTNTKDNPNENYGRELQELFTVGKGPDSLYTQADVEAAAKVLTGWIDNKAGIASSFNPDNHDTSDKQFSAFYNNTVISGQAGINGAYETDQLINMIFSQHETAKFLCRNLYRWFIYYNIDENAEANVISPLADIVVQNNFNIIPVLKVLFKSEHFFDPVNRGCFIKTPADHLIGVCRLFNIAFPDSTDATHQYTGWRIIAMAMAALTMDPGDPPNVAGWPAYHEAPAFHELWINSDTLPARNEYTDTLSAGGLHLNGVTLKIDFIAFAQQLSNPSDPNQLIADSVFLLSANSLDSTEAAFLKTILLSGQLSDSYWTTAWNDYISDPTNTIKKNVVLSRLRSLYTYMMDMPEFQLV